MSVLIIKDIAMPKEPWDCPCHDGENGRCKVTKNSCYQIPKDCPLVEVSTPQGELMSNLISRQVCDYEISDRGIERVINVDNCRSYTTELIISKEIFIKAYQKWILESGADWEVMKTKQLIGEDVARRIISSDRSKEQMLAVLDSVPSALTRCKDCKHFEYDHIENVNGIPLIIAHEICMRWCDGTKTSENGYCFLAERKENG